MALDFPKIQSPFVRENIDGRYVVTPRIAEGYEWVFTDDSVACLEKLDGTNVSIIMRDGAVQSIWNRTNQIHFFDTGKSFIVKGLINAAERGYLALPEGQHFGELIGPKVNGDSYQLREHIWIPFKTYAMEHLRYKSWGKYPRDYATISRWFQEDIFSLYFARLNKGCKRYPEGVVFHHPDGRMAKLRRDMFLWYTGKQHKE